MSAPDLEVIKEIPGYKVILKAVLKSQIQQLVEQLAAHTDEESVILTASISDGTLSHLGSESGKSFLQDHEDVKSQFLGFCLKKHHKKKQEQDRLEALNTIQQMPIPSQRYTGRSSFPPVRSMPQRSPRQQSPQNFRSQGIRHEPYPVSRIRVSKSPASVPPVPQEVQRPVNIEEVVKLEPVETAGESEINSDINTSGANLALTPSKTSLSSSNEESESLQKGQNLTDGSENIPGSEGYNDSGPLEGLGLDSDLSNIVTGEGNNSQDANSANKSSDLLQEVKVEAISESDMELEITGVEPGVMADPMRSAEEWGPDMSGYDPSGATGNQADMQGYSLAYTYTMEPPYYSSEYVQPGRDIQLAYPDTVLVDERTPGIDSATSTDLEMDAFMITSVKSMANDRERLSDTQSINDKKDNSHCNVCGKTVQGPAALKMHSRTHTGEKPFECSECGRRFSQKGNMQNHVATHKDKVFKCFYCGKVLQNRAALKMHVRIHTGEKPWECKKCRRGFTQKGNYKRHACKPESLY